jgi:UDP-N-acetylmuramoyl-tripeptide--D-alanyl-D-alanine ligase
MKCLIAELVAACQAELPAGLSPDMQVLGLSTDTRTLQPGQVFVALRGENFDGSEFAAQALQAGAVAVITSRPLPESPERQILVSDTLVALGRLASFWRGRCSAQVAAVTGSFGKTTTKDLLASICRVAGPTVSTSGTENNEIGVPQTLLRLEPADRFCVLEFGMRARGEIRQLTEIARPDLGLITGIGEAHIGRLGSREAIAESKAEMLPLLPPEGHAILPADDFFFPLLRGLCQCPVLSFGFGEQATVRCLEVLAETLTGVRFRLALPSATRDIALALPGRHNISNALAAAAAAVALGLDGVTIREGLQAYSAREMRGQVLTGPGGCTLINDTYNANPTAMTAALQTLSQASGRRVLVFGDMLELGETAPEAHRQVGLQAAEAGVSLLVAVGEMAALAAEAAAEQGVAVLLAADPEAAADLLRPLLQGGDTVLLKASRSMQLERTVRRLTDGT